MIRPAGLIFGIERQRSRDFPGGPAVRTPAPGAGSLGLIPDQGTRSHIPQLKDPACCN